MPDHISLDIDTMHDWLIAEYIKTPLQKPKSYKIRRFKFGAINRLVNTQLIKYIRNGTSY